PCPLKLPQNLFGRTGEYRAFKLWLCSVAEKAHVTFQLLLNPFTVSFGDNADRRPVAVCDEVFPKLRRHGFSSVQAPNGLFGDRRVAAISSRTRLRRASMHSMSWASSSGSTHSGGTSATISHSLSRSKDSIRLSQGSNDCHPQTC